ncbi:hypothetical protein LDJ79_24240 [Vibrio tritonius]|uniref:Uncharacterized protein n=1 Tax=Vibrio tritonius TaxID=1435069 RepID=A0ABS7YUD5_9VIBR|nr:hypothetical protein [Vibrio tritonius]MCA2019226.1 hypothetical protein [Vibrio tritonius]
MDSSYSGEKSARKEIEKFHVLLNHEAMIPAQCYRMSDNLYSLVCFTNQIVALFISKNYQMIPIFMGRVLTQLQKVQNQPGVIGYSKLVYDYLCQVAYYLDQFCNLDEEWLKSRIPQGLLKAGAQKAPEYDHEKMVIKLPDNWLIRR